jgi:hypothetical protein
LPALYLYPLRSCYYRMPRPKRGSASFTDTPIRPRGMTTVRMLDCSALSRPLPSDATSIPTDCTIQPPRHRGEDNHHSDVFEPLPGPPYPSNHQRSRLDTARRSSPNRPPDQATSYIHLRFSTSSRNSICTCFHTVFQVERHLNTKVQNQRVPVKGLCVHLPPTLNVMSLAYLLGISSYSTPSQPWSHRIWDARLGRRVLHAIKNVCP